MSSTTTPFSRGAARLLVACALVGTALTARADNLGGGTNINAVTHGCGSFQLDLNGARAGSNIPFTLPLSASPRRIAVLFNGECSVASTDDSTWLEVNIQLLDAGGALIATMSPSNSDNAFCTGTGDSALEHWVSASTIGQYVAPAGAAVGLQIRAVAHLVNCAGGETWRLDDTSTVVTR